MKDQHRCLVQKQKSYWGTMLQQLPMRIALYLLEATRGKRSKKHRALHIYGQWAKLESPLPRCVAGASELSG